MRSSSIVMPALVAGIHVLSSKQTKTWMAGTSPAMTNRWFDLNPSTLQIMAAGPNLDAAPLFDGLAHRREVRLRAEERIGDRQDLLHSRTDRHRHPHGVGFLQAQPDIFDRQSGGKADIARALHERPRTLV